eukprot:gene21442-25787_t
MALEHERTFWHLTGISDVAILDLGVGHLEVNPWIGDDAYMWILSSKEADGTDSSADSDPFDFEESTEDFPSTLTVK